MNYYTTSRLHSAVRYATHTTISLSSVKWRMDISVLPNNNHPEKFLKLDVRKLPVSHGVFQVGAAMTSQRHWQNRLYAQVSGLMIDYFNAEYCKGVI